MRNLVIIIIILFALYNISVNAQKKIEISELEKTVLAIPDSSARSVHGIATYIHQNFNSDSLRIKALYTWLSHNISYDVTFLFPDGKTYEHAREHADQIVRASLKAKAGVCMHYAQIFSDVANAMGIKSYVINGYVKQNNSVITDLGHAWCSARINSSWFMFDPTWGAGYINQNKFHKSPNYNYYMLKPEQMIKTHMPFDPLWQMQHRLISNKEFYEAKIPESNNQLYFNYTDTIYKYEAATELEQLQAVNNRIEKAGITNKLIKEYYWNNQQNANILLLNDAVMYYNEGVGRLNSFINYRNNQFKPEREETEIRQLIDSIEIYFTQSKQNLRKISKPKSDISQSMYQLNQQIEEVNVNLKEQKEFIDKYYSTRPLFRKTLFHKYTWFGVPLK